MDHPEQLLQLLSAMLIELNALQTVVHTDATPTDISTLHAGLHVLEQMTRQAVYTVRSGIEELLPPELEDATLAEALSRMAEETAERLNLSSRIAFSGTDEQKRQPAISGERLLLLLAREAFYEIAYHSGARRLRLALTYAPDTIQMSIEDDGLNPALQTETTATTVQLAERLAPPFATLPSGAEGQSTTQETASIFKDLRRRIENHGGSLEIVQAGERGTRVLAQIPYSQPQQHEMTISATSTNDRVANNNRQVAEGAPASIRVLIVDSQAVTRAGLHRLLEAYPGIQIVGEATDGLQAVSETLELGPQVVLMDTQLPEGQTLEALQQIKQLNLDTKVILFATQEREEYLYETLRAGADGFVLKDIAPDELVQAIRTVARGEILIQQQIAGRLLSRYGRQGRSGHNDSLTTRELEVLHLLARGMRNKEIANRLYVSERTVNFHLANIYQKLNVSGRTEALSKAIEQGLLNT